MKTLTRWATVTIIAGLVVLGGLTAWYSASPSPSLLSYSGPVEKITVSTCIDVKSTLLYIAQHKGYFSRNGLEVTLKPLPTGKMGCDEMKAGHVDIANFADFVLAGQVLGGATSLRCVGAIATADDHQLLFRKDRGILVPGDLRGRRIGTPFGTSAQFFLGRFLSFNDLAWNQVAVVDVPPTDLEATLENGRVDAVMIWEQWAEQIRKGKDKQIGSWPGQSGQKYYWLLVTTDDLVKAKPGVLERLFKALAQAEIFFKNQPEESLKIMAQWTGLNPAAVKAVWARSKIALSFDQSLLIILEDEARWMIKNELTGQTRVPNYLNYMQVAALSKVSPQVVNLIALQTYK